MKEMSQRNMNSVFSNKEDWPDIIVVGAGIFGLTIAERVASQLGKRVFLVERRNHIGGNAYSEFDKKTGIEVHKYGAHLFHTSRDRVWKYVNKFSSFTGYQHRVYTTHNNEVFPMPINLGTINQFFHKAYSPSEAKELIARQAKEIVQEPRNLRDKGISLIGRPLFEAFIMSYTAKQWQTPAENLPPDIITRLPIRFNYNNRYFNDIYEGLPSDGYATLFEKMLSAGKGKIELMLNTDYLHNEVLLSATRRGALTVFTGPIDCFFEFVYGRLNWRSIEFKRERIACEDYQGCSVMNYADLDVPYTRIIEFKHFNPERQLRNNGQTIIVKEFSKTWHEGDEPYYPVRTQEDLLLLKKYQTLARQYPNVLFGGRLGEYAYFDMDATFESALTLFDKVIRPRLSN